LGRLNPLDSNNPSSYSLAQRLANLGFLENPNDGDEPVALVDALIRFQLSRGLTPSGAPDAKTVDALAQAHEGTNS